MQSIVAPSNEREPARLAPLVSFGALWLWAWGLGLLEWGWILLDSDRFAHALFDFAPRGPFPYLGLLLLRSVGLALLVTLSFRCFRGEIPPLLVAALLTLALNFAVAFRVGPLRPLLISGTLMAQWLILLAGLRREIPAPVRAAPPASVPAGKPQS